MSIVSRKTGRTTGNRGESVYIKFQYVSKKFRGNSYNMCFGFTAKYPSSWCSGLLSNIITSNNKPKVQAFSGIFQVSKTYVIQFLSQSCKTVYTSFITFPSGDMCLIVLRDYKFEGKNPWESRLCLTQSG